MHSTDPGATRAARALAARRARGFTLIEILVVMVIISIIVASTAIAIGVLGGDRQSEDQARRLWAVMQQAREEAELQGLDAGVYLAASAYEFLRFQPRANAWQPIPDDPFYAPRQMPPGLNFSAKLDGRDIVLKPQLPSRTVVPVRRLTDEVRELGAPDEEDAKKKLEDGRKKEDNDNPSPQLVVLSSGEIMPFEVEIQREGAQAAWRVVGTADNDLRVERRGSDNRWELIAQTNPPDDEDEKNKKEASRGRR